MKAALLRDYGINNDVIDLVEIPVPRVLPDSVLVKVHASSVNPIDNILRAGYLRNSIPLKFPMVMGNDVSGVVVEVGENVKGFVKGDSVFGRPNPTQSGTFADYAVIKASDLALKPANITHLEAASVPLVALTAWQALVEKANLQRGQKVLIHAGSGGVGSVAIQIAKHLGAYVATTTSTENVEFVKHLGADLVIDYKVQKFEQILEEFDVVLDTLGGETQAKSFPVLRKGGCLVSITGTREGQALAEQCGVQFELFFMRADGEQLSQIAQLIHEQKINPIVDRVFELDQIKDAMNYSLAGRTRGKIVIRVQA